jgi:hypothetical protein
MFSKKDFRFKLETWITDQRPPAIRIELMSKSGSAQSFSTKRENKIVPQETLNFRDS